MNDRTSAYSSWEDYHTVPGREYSTSSSFEADDSSRSALFGDNLFVHFTSYPQVGCAPDAPALDYSQTRPENFFDGIGMSEEAMSCENSGEQTDDECPAEFASLVNLVRDICNSEWVYNNVLE